jgi:hypothetical protein
MGLLDNIKDRIRRSNDEAHVRVGDEWMSGAEYRARFGVPAPQPYKASGDVQLELFPNLPATGNTIDERFADFHAKNPHVYRNLVKLALADRTRGRRRGIAVYFEELRYAYERTEHDPKDYKLNNDYASRYARLIMANEPVLAGQFEVRRLKAL